ncbi:MAG TPA: hypothetical protein VMV28_05560 [Thermoplasmata archaeon]|nr:hypothetical protein [Thermoplasmata archaeon]
MHANPDGTMGSLDDLKQVKEAELEWEAKVRAAATARKAVLDRLNAETDAIVKAERASAGESREFALKHAREVADREAAQIVADGERAAAAARVGTGKGPAQRSEEILNAVLGSFRGK